jgi:flagellar basal body-associated protein FliL
MQLSGLFNSGLPVKVVGTLILGGVVYVSVVYLNRKWKKRTAQTTPQTTPAPIPMTNIGDNVEENTQTQDDTDTGGNTN